MDDILEAIRAHCGFLYKRFGFRIIDSKVYLPDCYEGEVTMESRNVRIRFVSDRKQVFLELQPTSLLGEKQWSDLDLVLTFVDGTPVANTAISRHNATLLEVHMEDIFSIFQPDRMQDTLANMKQLMKARAKSVRLALKKPRRK